MSIERDYNQIDTIFIHCAATPNGREVNAADINDWHGPGRQSKGFRPFTRHSSIAEYHTPELKHIGYHYVIKLNGIVELGRSIKETGAHAAGHNVNSVGICVVGMDKFTDAQWNALRTVIRYLLRTLPSIKHIRGHREVQKNKTCPGFSVSDWIANDMATPPAHLLTLEEPNG